MRASADGQDSAALDHLQVSRLHACGMLLQPFNVAGSSVCWYVLSQSASLFMHDIHVLLTALLCTVAVAGGCQTRSSSTAAAMHTRPWASGRVRQKLALTFPAQKQLVRYVLSSPSCVCYGSPIAWMHAAFR